MNQISFQLLHYQYYFWGSLVNPDARKTIGFLAISATKKLNHWLAKNYYISCIYCTISNNSAKGGDRGQSGQNFGTGHAARGQGTRPPISAMANLANQFRAKLHGSQSGGGQGTVTKFGQNHKAGDRGPAELFEIVQYVGSLSKFRTRDAM